MNALLDIKKIIKNADFSAIKDISTAGENDVALVKNVLKLIDPTSAVTFATGKISAKSEKPDRFGATNSRWCKL